MIAPLALIGLLAVPVIVAFYMLRLRRRDVPVGSTFLWQQLVRDVEANAPWQRLRFSWLLLVLLLVALLVFGPKRLPELGRSLGRGMREFKESVSGVTGKNDEEDEEHELGLPPAAPEDEAELAETARRERNVV